MHAFSGNRKRQQLIYVIVFPAIMLAGFLVPKVLGYSDPVVVGSGFLSVLVTVFAFYGVLHWRKPPAVPKDLPKPNWIFTEAPGSTISLQSIEARGFELVTHSVVEGIDRHWYFREEELAEGGWRQDLEIADGCLCAHRLLFNSSQTMFGDDGWYHGTGHFLKPHVLVEPGPA